MSEVAGCLAPQVGAYSLMKARGGRGVLMGAVGGVANAKVVIIGAGVSGWNASTGCIAWRSPQRTHAGGGGRG
jgi:alanine dehydrogenase